MTLYMIGLGLNDEKDISIKGVEAIKKCKYVYLEGYTSRLSCSVKELEKLYKKKIILADRELVEQKAEKTILKCAKKENVAFLVPGDVFSATTHIDLWLRAKKSGIKVNVIHNASIITAVGITGLQIYKFGRTSSIPKPEKGFMPETPYDAIKDNKKLGLHTLLLLDLELSVKDAISCLLEIEKKRKEKVFTEDTSCVVCSEIGSEKQIIRKGKAKLLINKDFGKGPYCIIVPGKLHFMEEEIMNLY